MTNITDARSWHDRPQWGIWLMLGSVLIHVSGIVFEKRLLGVYLVPQMACMRSLVRLIPLFATLLRHREIRTIFAVQQPFTHLFRLTAFVSYNYCMLYALSKASLTMIGSLQYITPFITIALGIWFLNEKMNKDKWIAVAATTVGLLIALRPSGEFDRIALLILFASLLGSINRILIRKLTATEHSLAITVFGNLAMVIISLPMSFIDWHPLSWHDLSFFGIAGVLTAAAQFLSVQALRFAQASLIAPLDCTSIIWGALFDFCIWQVIPSSYLVLGAAIMIASNFYLLKSAKRKEREIRN